MNSHYGPNHYQRRQHETVYTTAPNHPPYPQHYNVPYHHIQQQYHQSPHYYQHPLQSPTQQYGYPPMGVPQYPAMPSPSMMHRPPYNPYTPPPNPATRPQMLSPPPQPSRLSQAPSVARNRPSPPPAPPPQIHHPHPVRRMPYYPPLPWYSVPESTFPQRDPRRRRRRPRPPLTSDAHLELPTRNNEPVLDEQPRQEPEQQLEPPHEETPIPLPVSTPEPAAPEPREAPSTLVESTSSFTPTTSKTPSEADSTQPTTPSSAVAPTPRPNAVSGSKAPNHPTKRRVPLVPAVPNIPSLKKPAKQHSISTVTGSTKHAKSVTNEDHINGALVEASKTHSAPNESEVNSQPIEATPTVVPVEAKVAPKSWADLVRTKAPLNASLAATDGKNHLSNGFGNSQALSLSEALSTFDITQAIADTKVSFLKPRGLVNTGNMCYMNSVLQVLVSCVPFYAFLGEVARQAVHSFNSQTPMLDAMIMFMREFPVIDSATSVEQLRMRLQQNELEQYGEAFTPDFVYEVIRRLPRFSTMRRGHQQDAEEFLGFLLEELHDECTKVMRSPLSDIGSPTESSVDGFKSPDSESRTEDSGWLEVGPKQKAAITRSSGVISKESPITKIFGGKLRSELRVPGAKNSVTQESYQALQLDIGSSTVNNILDALKGLTRSETLHGDFNSPRGPGTPATKQVFIETLPPVLILHLKRFQYDNTGGTQKIWKKVGYPLDLEIPKEVFPPHRRGGLVAHNGLPKYRLISVVYHHGKNASGGHYTVDVRRQDGREWIRLDDTVIRRLRTEEVAEGGSEEDPKILAAVLEQHKRDQSTSNSSIFDQVRQEEEEKETAEQGWSQVNGGGSLAPGGNGQSKKWSGVVNGVTTPASDGKKTPTARTLNKEGKVAYLLFYQRIGL